MTRKQEVEDDDRDAGINGSDERLERNNDGDVRRDEQPPDAAAVALKDEPESGEALPVSPPPPLSAAPVAAVVATGQAQLTAAPTRRATKVI